MCFIATGIGNDLAIGHSRTLHAETVRLVESVKLICARVFRIVTYY